MVESYLRHSPLASLGLQALSAAPRQHHCLRLREMPVRGQLALRGGDSDTAEAFATAVSAVLGFPPPQPCSASVAAADNADKMLWLGPDEWLVSVRYGMQGGVETALREQLSPLHHAITDVSHSRCIIEVSGDNARKVLQKGCAIDLHERAFNVGDCVQSQLARCHLLLHQTATAPLCYELYIHRSFACYAYHWLTDAASEYQSISAT